MAIENIIAELPGTHSEEIVMVGAHLDSWRGGTGATDNAAGVAIAMEALRILKALNVPLRRTVRLALWSGEEQGELGSTAFVNALPKKTHGITTYVNLDTGRRTNPGSLCAWQSHRDSSGPHMARTVAQIGRNCG